MATDWAQYEKPPTPAKPVTDWSQYEQMPAAQAAPAAPLSPQQSLAEAASRAKEPWTYAENTGFPSLQQGISNLFTPGERWHGLHQILSGVGQEISGPLTAMGLTNPAAGVEMRRLLPLAIGAGMGAGAEAGGRAMAKPLGLGPGFEETMGDVANLATMPFASRIPGSLGKRALPLAESLAMKGLRIPVRETVYGGTPGRGILEHTTSNQPLEIMRQAAGQVAKASGATEALAEAQPGKRVSMQPMLDIARERELEAARGLEHGSVAQMKGLQAGLRRVPEEGFQGLTEYPATGADPQLRVAGENAYQQPGAGSFSPIEVLRHPAGWEPTPPGPRETRIGEMPGPVRGITVPPAAGATVPSGAVGAATPSAPVRPWGIEKITAPAAAPTSTVAGRAVGASTPNPPITAMPGGSVRATSPNLPPVYETVRGAAPEPQVATEQPPREFLQIRRGLGRQAAWDPMNPEKDTATMRRMYGAATRAFHEAVPGTEEYDRIVHSLIPVLEHAKTSGYIESFPMRVLSRVQARTGALAPAILGAATGHVAPALLGGMLPEYLTLPSTMMRGARGIYGLGTNLAQPGAGAAAAAGSFLGQRPFR